MYQNVEKICKNECKNISPKHQGHIRDITVLFRTFYNRVETEKSELRFDH